jgi:SAM-dependent methyltransferase
MADRAKIFTAVFFAAAAGLAFEVSLTRIFSISLWYHFAFMVISIAMLGLALSGTAISLFPKLKNISRLGSYCLFLGLSLSAGYLLVNRFPFDPVKLQWSNWQILYIGAYYVVLMFPFFFVGLIIAGAFASASWMAPRIYAADLLGAGFGSVAILFLISLKGPEYPIFWQSVVLWVLAFLLGGRAVKIAAALMIPLLLLTLLLWPGFFRMHISPYKEMPTALRYPGARHLRTYHSAFSRIDTFESPAVRFAPGLSLKYQEPLPLQVGFAVDGDAVNAVTSIQDREKLAFLSYLPAALVYEMAAGSDDVLVLDPKGGLGVLLARHYRSSRVYKVESNPLLVKVVRRQRRLSGSIYRQRTWTGLGRAWLKSHPLTFDIIELSLMSGIPGRTSALAEDYRLTREAFSEYIRHLKPGGLLSLSLYITPPPRSEFRLLTTLVSAMAEAGIDDPSGHLAAIRSWGSLTLVMKRTPLTAAEIEGIKTFSRQRLFDLLYYPGMRPGEADVFIQTQGQSLFRAFTNLINRESRSKFIDDYLFDIAPVCDDRPFFHYFMKFENMQQIYRMTGGKWEYFIREGYILAPILVQVLVFSLILIFLPLIVKMRRTEEETDSGRGGQGGMLFYFAFLGLGFMFLEVGLIQRSILVLENSAYAVAVVLASLLIGAGCGSLLSGRFKTVTAPRLTLTVALLIPLYSLTTPLYFALIMPLGLGLKFCLFFVFVLPLGLFLGIPFPSGIRFLGGANPQLIPWAWAINGFFSVVAPIVAMLLALSFGFTLIFWLASSSYLLAFLTFSLLSHSPP